MSRLSLPAALAAFALLAAPAVAQTPAYTILSPTPRAPGHFGGVVVGIPDVDGDGRADLVVAADWEAGLAGSVHVFSGATGVLIRTIQSPSPSTNPIGSFGLSVAALPDVTGDGVADLAIGAGVEGSSATGYGRVHVFNGATGALVRSQISPNPEGGGGQAFPSYGCAVAGVPDLDGDGRGEILVGACREDTNDAGRAYLLSGASGTLLRTLSSPNPEANGSFGNSVSAVPDVDGDGKADLLVAAQVEDAPLSNAGRAYLFSGATGLLLRTFTSPTPTNAGLFGRTAVGVADANGDGRGDVLIGATGEGAPATSGRAYLLSGTTGAVLRTFESPNAVSGGRFGSSVAEVPDVNGDGQRDYAVGAPIEAGGASSAGRAYLFSGATGAILRTLQSPNPQSSGFFGNSVAGVPDADGDGRGDLLVGATQESAQGASTGRAYLFSGLTLVAAEPNATAAGLALTVAPNPARGAATLTLELDAPQAATVEVYDALGRRVARLHDGLLPSGRRAFTLDASALPAGVYVARAAVGDAVLTHRLTVVR